MKLYYAAPWFTPEQADIHSRVYKTLKTSGHNVFSPKHELEVGPDANLAVRRKAFQGNIAAILRSDIVIGVTDYKDIGTIWECGFAYACGVAIIYYAETLGDRPFNLMLAQSGLRVVRNCADLLDLLVKIRSTSDLQEVEYEGKVE